MPLSVAAMAMAPTKRSASNLDEGSTAVSSDDEPRRSQQPAHQDQQQQRTEQRQPQRTHRRAASVPSPRRRRPPQQQQPQQSTPGTASVAAYAEASSSPFAASSMASRLVPIEKHYDRNDKLLILFRELSSNARDGRSPALLRSGQQGDGDGDGLFGVAYAVGLAYVETALFELPRHGYYYAEKYGGKRRESLSAAVEVSTILSNLVERADDDGTGGGALEGGDGELDCVGVLAMDGEEKVHGPGFDDDGEEEGARRRRRREAVRELADLAKREAAEEAARDASAFAAKRRRRPGEEKERATIWEEDAQGFSSSIGDMLLDGDLCHRLSLAVCGAANATTTATSTKVAKREKTAASAPKPNSDDDDALRSVALSTRRSRTAPSSFRLVDCMPPPPPPTAATQRDHSHIGSIRSIGSHDVTYCVDELPLSSSMRHRDVAPEPSRSSELEEDGTRRDKEERREKEDHASGGMLPNPQDMGIYPVEQEPAIAMATVLPEGGNANDDDLDAQWQADLERALYLSGLEMQPAWGVEDAEQTIIDAGTGADASCSTLSVAALARCYREDFNELRDAKRIKTTRLSTHQGRLPGSVNGCTVIAPLLCMHYLRGGTLGSDGYSGDRGHDGSVPDDVIARVIDTEAPKILPEVRSKLGLTKDALIVPADVHDHFLGKGLLTQDQFVAVCGGNVLDEAHLERFLSSFLSAKQKRVAATLFFHEHVVALHRIRPRCCSSTGDKGARGVEPSCWIDLIDSLPNARTLFRTDGGTEDPVGKSGGPIPPLPDPSSISSPILVESHRGHGDDETRDVPECDHTITTTSSGGGGGGGRDDELQQPATVASSRTGAVRIRCADAASLHIALRWYACSRFTERDVKYIDAYPWDDRNGDFDPRVFQAFIWAE